MSGPESLFHPNFHAFKNLCNKMQCVQNFLTVLQWTLKQLKPSLLPSCQKHPMSMSNVDILVVIIMIYTFCHSP